MTKTLPLLMAGLLATAGAFAQSSGASSGASSMDTLPGTSGASSSSSSTMGAGPSTGTMGASSTPEIVVVQPTVAVPVAVPVYVQRDSRSERYSGNRAVDTGNGQLESNMGPYDNTWRNSDRGRSGSY
jgi:hypothetical protein